MTINKFTCKECTNPGHYDKRYCKVLLIKNLNLIKTTLWIFGTPIIIKNEKK